MIQVRIDPDELLRALRVVDPFRGGGGRTAGSVVVRYERGGRRQRLDLTAQDGLHAVRCSVPLLPGTVDPGAELAKGVTITLPLAEAARVHAAWRRVRAQARRERDGRTGWEAVLTVSSRGGHTTFGMSSAGSWNGCGCYLYVTGPRDVPAIAGGRRHDVKAHDLFRLAPTSTRPIDGARFDPGLLTDITVAAERFGAGGGHLVDLQLVDVKPTGWRFTATNPDSGCSFEAMMFTDPRRS